MNLLEALGHVVNLFLPAVLLGGLAAALAKLAWRRRLTGVRWWHLAWPAAAAAAVATLAGLVLLGQDGRMLTYMAMVAASAAALGWRGFRRRS